MTYAERFAQLRPLAPATVCDRLLMDRIRRKQPDWKCIREPLTDSQAGNVGGRNRALDMKRRGLKPVSLPGSRPSLAGR